MPIKLYDTLTAKTVEFVPQKEKEIKMYVCGVTVYDECHLGHARAAICFDVIRKYFEYSGYDVKMVVNFTDVDDKIINRAKLEKKDALEISSKYIDKYFIDMDRLHIKRATHYPKATEHISHIIEFVKALIEKGAAYVVEGDVYFEVSKFKERQRTNLRKGNIGFVFQSFNLIDELTVYENVELPLLYLKVSPSERRRKVSEVLERMKITHRKKHFPQQLSGGQQQRVAISRAVVTKPMLILADEPTGNLDSTNGEEVMNLLTELNNEGTTIVMVTHSPSDADKAHRIIQLFDGHIVTENIRQIL